MLARSLLRLPNLSPRPWWRQADLNELLLIQWFAPRASEAPAVSVGMLFVLANRAGNGLTAIMISAKINQWMLLVGMPLAIAPERVWLLPCRSIPAKMRSAFSRAPGPLFGLD